MDNTQQTSPISSTPPLQNHEQQGQSITLDEKLEQIRIQELEEKARSLATATQLPFIDLTLVPIDKTALALLPESRARETQFVIIERVGKRLRAASVDPLNTATQNLIHSLESDGYTIRLFVASQRGMAHALELYKEIQSFEKARLGVVQIGSENIQNLQRELEKIDDLKKKIEHATTTQLIELFLAGALKFESSDIHLEPEERIVRLRYRVDGVLQNILDLEPSLYTAVLNRLKLTAGMKLNIHEKPQDGRFTIRLENVDIEIRVSVLPGAYGESIVMRILDPRTIKTKLEDLGMRNELLAEMKKQLKRTTGAILTTGPTGSGKTTTLYAFLQYVNEPGVKIITIEDPIEYHIEGISQTQVNPQKGYTFANGLRAIVRQDPDVVLVGEIRDVETAEIAMHASLTGHLVFSTIHTNDAAGAIPRLIDLGVKPQIIAPAINVAMAQRLVRRLCNECKKSRTATKEEQKKLITTIGPLKERLSLPSLETLTIFEPTGCEVCHKTGYKGRIAVFEIFIIDQDIERLILQSPAISDIRDAAIKKGMITLLQDGYIKIVEGITDFQEVERVIGET